MGRRLSAEGIEFERCRQRLGVPDAFAAEIDALATERARSVALPARDLTEVPFVTIDPPGSLDLDQAVHIARRLDGTGFVVQYAIADVNAFVHDGDALDAESRKRGVTVYAPDRRSPVYPDVIGQGAASLLPGEVRPAIVWRLELDSDAQPIEVAVDRAIVRSRDKLDYPTMQAAADGGHLPEPIALLPDFGARRALLARARHAINLDLPEQAVVAAGDGWQLEFREPYPIELWNAEVSLLTGMAAAGILIKAGIGLLRTVPPAAGGTVDHLHRVAAALGVAWPRDVEIGDLLAALDSSPRSLAMREATASLLRGAGYTAFDGSPPGDTSHAGVGAPYAHVTAPLRRLADRFVNEVAVSVANGRAVPDDVRHALPELPELMAAGDHRAHGLERCVLDHVEALVLAVGQVLDGVVVEADRHEATVVVHDPAIRTRVEGDGLQPASAVQLRVVAVDTDQGRVRFAINGPRSTSPAGGGR